MPFAGAKADGTGGRPTSSGRFRLATGANGCAAATGPAGNAAAANNEREVSAAGLATSFIVAGTTKGCGPARLGSRVAALTADPKRAGGAACAVASARDKPTATPVGGPRLASTAAQVPASSAGRAARTTTAIPVGSG